MGNRPKLAAEIPLYLPRLGCWELEVSAIDSGLFFRTIAHTFPEATTAYFEGTSVEVEIADLFERHSELGKYLPESQTIWPRPKQFRCRFSAALCSELADLADRHAEPELLDHLFLYASNQPIVEWPDAFHNSMWISQNVSELRVSRIAEKLGVLHRMCQQI